MRLRWTIAALSLAACCEKAAGPSPGGINAGALLLWRDSTPGDHSRPLIGDSAIFVLNSSSNVIVGGNSSQHEVAALSKADGHTLWRTQLPVTHPGEVGYGLQLVRNVVVVGDGDVFGLNPSTGAVLWTYAPSAGYYPGYYFQAADSTTVFCGSGSGHVFAVDALTGQERWATLVTNGQNRRVFSPIYSNGVVYVSVNDFVQLNGSLVDVGAVAALSATSGQIIWKTVFDPPSGQKISIVQGIAISGPRALVGIASGPLLSLNRLTGVITDSVPATAVTIGATTQGAGLEVFADSQRIVVASSLNTLTALDPANLSKRWQVSTRNTPSNATLRDTLIVVHNGGSRFDVYDVRTGSVLWQLRAGDLRKDELEVGHWAPSVDATRLYFGGFYETYAFRRP